MAKTNNRQSMDCRALPLATLAMTPYSAALRSLKTECEFFTIHTPFSFGLVSIIHSREPLSSGEVVAFAQIAAVIVAVGYICNAQGYVKAAC